MEKAIRVVFNLHPGEGLKSLLFILLGFLWSVGSYGMFTLSEGMFLEHVGAAKLPLTYVFVSLTLCLISAGIIVALNHLSIRKILALIITAWSLCIGTFYLLHSLSTHVQYWYLLKIFGWIMPISTYICYWAFIDQYMDLQTGKRLFCLINSVTFMGDACGAGIISVALDRLGLGGILLLFGSIIALSLPFIYLITKTLTPIIDDHADHLDTRNCLSIKDIIQKILTSKFTLYLLGFYFVMQLVVIVTEFSYMKSFDFVFSHTSENELTRFLGTCNMWISFANVLFSIFLYSRLVRKMGVNNITLVAPFAFLFLFGLWFFKEGLSIAIFGLFAREGLTYLFDDNNLNLLISGVPTKIKNQVRITVESFFEPFGMLISASLLFFFHNYSHALGFIVTMVACFLAFFLRGHYSKAIFDNLIASSIRFGKKAIDWIPKKEKAQFEFHLLATLRHPDESNRLLAFEYLIRLKNQKYLPRLLNTINNLSLPSKIKAIELLSKSPWAKESIVIERLDRWRRIIPYSSLRGAIHFYFAKHALIRPEKIMADLHSNELSMRGAAILSMKSPSVNNTLPSLVTLASEKLKAMLDSKIEHEICMAIEILGHENNEENISHLLPYLKHPSKEVTQSAAKALAELFNPEVKKYTETLLYHLNHQRDVKTRYHLLQAIDAVGDSSCARDLILASVHFRPNERAMIEEILFKRGSELNSTLLSIMQDRFIHERCRLLAGKVLARFDVNLLKQHLYPILKTEIDRAYFYYYHFMAMQKQESAHDLSILVGALETGFHSVIDFVIQLLGSASSLEQSEVLSHSLKSRNQKIQAQAVETLQKTCDARFFSLLEPLISGEESTQYKLRTYLKRGHVPLTLHQLLDAMIYSPSLTDQIVAIGLKARLGLPGWREILKKKLERNEEIFHHFAHELLEGTP